MKGGVLCCSGCQMHKLMPFALVGLGGMAGSMLRYGFALLLQRWTVAVPGGTLAANLLGCFLIGLLTEASARGGWISPSVRLLLGTGFCGGLTTMSSFIYEAGRFAEDSEWWLGLLYFGGTLLGCLVAFAAAVVLVRLAIPQ